MSKDRAVTAAAGESPSEHPRTHRGVWLFARDILLILLAALVLSFLIKTFFVRSFYIPSPSMVNTLQINDRVIVSLLTPTLVPLRRGDIVVFEDPGGWNPEDELPQPSDSPVTDVLAFLGLAAPDDNSHLIKRVIGLPGDRVACCTATGHLTVNGTPIEEPYITLNLGATAADPQPFRVTVPKNDLWVMGDNRDASADSAYHFDKQDATPYVPLRDVTGKAVVISWPIGRWTVLSNYPDTFLKVKPPSSK
ncbi:MAG TPA: signal peptidase I [Galbitalea sp.]|jgi:signal peptidase I|nr:signal peptidase I [Galbitalea sp.]